MAKNCLLIEFRNWLRDVIASMSENNPWRRPQSRLRRLNYSQIAVAEVLECRELLSAALPFDDSSLAPAGLQTVTAMPNLPVFNVKDYGAKGDGVTDDTLAIRATINAAVAGGQGGIIFLPTGTYDVAPQAGDAEWNPLFPVIFSITSSNLVFLGEGANNTVLKGYMQGLQDPTTHWNVTGNSYSKISRFGMFRIDSTNGPVSNVEFRSLNIDGNAGYTGNFVVGGNITTGDGWDMSHKAIAMDGANPIDNVLVFNTTIDNWRGEELYSGGGVGRVYAINDWIYGSNASAISSSSNMLIANTTIGGTAAGDDVYNGIENLDRLTTQKTVVQDSTILCSSDATNRHGNGIVFLGVEGTSLTVTNTQIQNNSYGILFSEAAHNVTIENDTFTNNTLGMMDSVLGLYLDSNGNPLFPTGFSDFLIEGNTFNDLEAGYGCQGNGAGYDFPNLVLRDNTVVGGVLIQGAFNGTFAGFIVDGNTIGNGATDTWGWQGDKALWSNTTRLPGSVRGTDDIIDPTQGETTTVIAPVSDLVKLDYNQTLNGTQYVTMDPTTLVDYPVGFQTLIKNGPMSNWVLKADSTWNTFTGDQTIGPNGLTIRVNANHLFEIVTTTGASKLTLAQMPTSGTAGQALTPSVQVAVQDQFGNVVAGDSSTVTLTLSGGVFAGGGTTVSIQAVDGVATFGNLVINASGTYTLSASDGTLTGATSGNITVAAAAASKLVILQSPATGTAGQALSPSVQVAVEDPFGNVVASDSSTVTLKLNGGVFAGGGTTASVQAVNGLAAFSNLVINSSGTYAFSASDGALTGANSGNIAVTAAAASKLVILQSPTTGAAGQALSPWVKIAVEDQFGNIATGDSSTVSLVVYSGPAGFAGGSITSVAAVSGVATFGNLVLATNGAYILSASDGALTGANSGSIGVTAAAASKLAFVQTPTTGTAGLALSPAVKVAVQDQFGNVIAGNNSVVTLTLKGGVFAGGGTTVTAQAVGGVATFGNLVINASGTYTLMASDGSLTGATSGNITVGAAAASKLVILQAPATGTAGLALSLLKVAVEDQFGNVVTGNSSTVSLVVGSGPAGFATGSTTGVAAINGVATFSKLIFNTSGTYALRAADGLLTAANSGAISVSAAAASKLVFQQVPLVGNIGKVVSPSIIVLVEDQFGNVVTNNTSSVTIAVKTAPRRGGFSSTSTIKVAVVNGRATFSSLTFTRAGTYTLSVSDGTLTGATSGSITVS